MMFDYQFKPCILHVPYHRGVPWNSSCKYFQSFHFTFNYACHYSSNRKNELSSYAIYSPLNLIWEENEHFYYHLPLRKVRNRNISCIFTKGPYCHMIYGLILWMTSDAHGPYHHTEVNTLFSINGPQRLEMSSTNWHPKCAFVKSGCPNKSFI